MLPLFTITIFLGSALLFLVQPMIAKAVLPVLGGSPAVWNTAMVFFQASLLAGYLYTHGLARLRRVPQASVHVVVALGCLALLPIGLPAWDPPASSWPIAWVLGALAVAVGAPFFLLASNAPLLQLWFSRTSHFQARDPYFLYAASNAGSLLALAAYPVLVEPLLGLRAQRLAWSVAFAVFVALMLACRVVAWRAARSGEHPAERSDEPDEPAAHPVAWRRRLLWVLLAAVPSSLLLGATQYISTDIAAVPLLWVVPLAIYLLTFILAFAKRARVSTKSLARLLPIIATAMAVAFLLHARQPIAVLMAMHLLGLFIASMLCHQRLANDRPAPARLTEFYLLIAVGGVLGGAFNALLAPVVFDVVAEYPIAIALACALIPGARDAEEPASTRVKRRALDVALPALLIGALAFIDWQLDTVGIVGGLIIQLGLIGLPAAACYLMSKRPIRFALALAGLMIFSLFNDPYGERTLERHRTFFGVHTIVRDETPPEGDVLRLSHGTTTHGVQLAEGPNRREPTLYYTREGPLGDVFREMQARHDSLSVAAVGLGVGAAAAYARPDDSFDFYEIDPAVARIASDWARFTFLPDAPGDTRVILGDARLKLEDAPDNAYDLIILDAFTSDAIPVHLLTREALQLYLRKLASGGVIAFHLSNRYLELTRVVDGLADAEGLTLRVRVDPGPPDASADAGGLEFPFRAPSTWAVLGRDTDALGRLATSGTWLPPDADSTPKLWTDDYSDILSLLLWF